MAFPLDLVAPATVSAVSDTSAVNLDLLTATARLAFNPDGIPDSLKTLSQWTCWRFKDEGKGKPGKPPIDARTGRYASSTDPSTWTTFDAALTRFNADSSIAGLNLILTTADPIVAIDIDDYGDSPNPMAALALSWFAGTYAEKSPSGGLHIFALGQCPGGLQQKNGIFEVRRTLTVTGDRVEVHPADLTAQQAGIDLYSRHCLCGEPLPGIDDDDGYGEPLPDCLSMRCPRCGEAAEYPDCEACGYDLTQPPPDPNSTDTEKNGPAAPADLLSVSVGSVDYARRLELALTNSTTAALYHGDFSAYGDRSRAELALALRLLSFADGDTDVVADWLNGSQCGKWLERSKDSDVYRRNTLTAALNGWDGVCFEDKRQPDIDHGRMLADALLRGRDKAGQAETEPAQTGATEPAFKFCDLRQLRGASLQPPAFVINPLIPRGHLTLFGGHGGSGKTTVAFVLAAHVACGADWRNLPVTAGKVLIASFEDGQDLVLWRLKNIVEEYGLDFDAIENNLTVIDATDAAAIMTEAAQGGIRQIVTTKDGAALANHIRQQQYDLVIIDNASDAFDGDENHRRQVRQFVRYLAKSVSAHSGAILLLAHIDKSAARYGASGNSYSGSTGWHNSARSRLALIDNELRQEKLNVGKAMPDPIPLVWTDKAVPIPADSAGAQLAQSLVDGQDDKALLACFDVAASIGDIVPAAKTRQTAYQLFIAYDELPKHLREDRLRFQKTMNRLLRRGAIHEETYRNADRKEKTRLVKANPD